MGFRPLYHSVNMCVQQLLTCRQLKIRKRSVGSFLPNNQVQHGAASNAVAAAVAATTAVATTAVAAFATEEAALSVAFV